MKIKILNKIKNFRFNSALREMRRNWVPNFITVK